MDAQQMQPRVDRIEMIRLWILGVLVLGLLGTVTELILLEHYEQPLQFVPLVLIVLALGALGWDAARHDRAGRRSLQVIMALFVLAGFAGVIVHFIGSAEFQLELDPQMSMWALLEKVLRAKAPPVLAPGMMLQFGLLGFAYIYSDSRYRRSTP